MELDINIYDIYFTLNFKQILILLTIGFFFFYGLIVFLLRIKGLLIRYFKTRKNIMKA